MEVSLYTHYSCTEVRHIYVFYVKFFAVKEKETNSIQVLCVDLTSKVTSKDSNTTSNVSYNFMKFYLDLVYFNLRYSHPTQLFYRNKTIFLFIFLNAHVVSTGLYVIFYLATSSDREGF